MPNSLVDDLAAILSRKLEHRVTVHRVPLHGRKPSPSAVSYSIMVEGCRVPFQSLTVGEAKARLSMMLDLFDHGIIRAGSRE